jgi:hypothetical protein
MFLFALGGSLVLGAGLLAAASYSEGTLVAVGTAAQGIGWLFILATIVGLTGLRHATFGRLGAATVTFLSGVSLLYVSYFEPGQVLDAPIRHAAAETLPAHEPFYKATLASMEVVMPVATKEVPETIRSARNTVAPAVAPQAAADRCAEKFGWAWVVCQERARLEYCAGPEADEATCPSAIPYSPPG